MSRKIWQVTDDWDDLFLHRNAYRSGEEEILLTEFADLVAETFTLIRKANSEYIIPLVAPSNALAIVNYLDLVAKVSRYAGSDYADDASKDSMFTATCMIAQKLANRATVTFSSYQTKAGIVLFETEEDKADDGLYFSRYEHPRTEEEFDAPPVEYHVYTGDFTDLLTFLADK